jgi:acetylornithine deacetylase/succinyl-diaminopimelate desuccinylase-like protein
LTATIDDRVHAALIAERDAIIARLCDFASRPSVSADPALAKGMTDTQSFLVDRLDALGFANVELLEAGGHAAVYGEWLGAPCRPTYLVYGHYDVQPPDPLPKWSTPPFEPTIKGDRLYGRGVSDDKGPSLIALETLGAFLRLEGGLPVNVKVLLEGEEEIGSATLPGILRRYRDRLTADAVISADGARWRPDLPTINVGSRGNAGFEFTVTTAVKDLHSGRYGGAVPNALHVIATLVASLHDSQGRIAVQSFYDGILPLQEAERAAMAAIPFDEARFFAELETDPFGEPGFTSLERLWVRPTLEVNGMWGGYTGPGGKTVIPNEAHAKITMRLVPGQDPTRVQEVVIEHLRRNCPSPAKITFRVNRSGSAAYLAPADHPLLAAAEQVLEETLGRKALRVHMGATLPLTDMVLRELGIDTVMFSFATSDEDYHAPNEFFRLSAIDEGLRAWVKLLRHLGNHQLTDYEPFRRAVSRA